MPHLKRVRSWGEACRPLHPWHTAARPKLALALALAPRSRRLVGLTLRRSNRKFGPNRKFGHASIEGENVCVVRAP